MAHPVEDEPTAATRGTPAGQAAADASALASQVSDLEDRWRRALADAENLRKRYARQLPRELAAERDRVAAAWLPVVDNLERALAHAGDETDSVIDGVRTVRDQAIEVLAALGYPRDDEIGVAFDPERHEAVLATPADDVEPFTVLQVVRPGYGEGEHRLRPAAVVVSSGRA